MVCAWHKMCYTITSFLYALSIQIERLVEVASNLAIKEWRRLPSIVSHIHVPLLQVSGYKISLDFSFHIIHDYRQRLDCYCGS